MVPVTVIDITSLIVVGKRTPEKDKYSAIALGFGVAKENRLTAAQKGSFKKAGAPGRKIVKEFRVSAEEVAALNVGDEVKADMEKSVPMDRIVCGDVGYGKTEIAVRAAFKAVQDGKQVAVLVPTTLLVRQHQQTFAARFAPFPIRVEALSRFQSPKESKQVLEGISDGTVDVVIATHRLLSPQTRFKDLGLVIVDEEQRFGVSHKERLKQMRSEVDSLVLSATPIPRTLQMSLVGIRDMSTVMTPPEERQPIRTYVLQWDDELLREAIDREMQRGGQVLVGIGDKVRHEARSFS